jgi:hypothetical protein
MEGRLAVADRTQWGTVYQMSVRDDTFVHFTLASRAEQIVAAGRLMQRPPYPKFGTDTVDAVSLTFGEYVPSVQTTHIRPQGGDAVAAVVFRTTVAPTSAHAEEVKWETNVPLIGAKVVPVEQAVAMLRAAPQKLADPDRDSVRYTA